MYKLGFEKAEEPEIKLLTSIGSQKKQENSRKISAFASLTPNCGKFLEMEIPDSVLQRNWWSRSLDC